MENEKYIHIISFDIPFPPDYGGVIDVFYKIKYLHQAGFKIILHCFQYNEKSQSVDLEKLCYQVYYYERKTTLKKHFCTLPYTVYSRLNKQLLNNLLKDDYPILFETLHTAYFINHPSISNRKKILRLSNIEHHYYYHLFLSEKKFLKKLYFLTECIKLYFYEKKAFQCANYILPVTEKDSNYVKKFYSNITTITIPSLHPFNDNSVWKGKGEYLLYHGNLSVAENYKAAEFLIHQIAPKITIPVIIAGKNPTKFLFSQSKKHKHIQIVSNPDENEMKQLIQNAHIVWLYTHQSTGLKLKLIHSLFTARFIICNDKMLAGTSISPNPSLYIKNTAKEITSTIQLLQELKFNDEIILQRNQLLQEFDNTKHLNKLIEIIVNS